MGSLALNQFTGTSIAYSEIYFRTGSCSFSCFLHSMYCHCVTYLHTRTLKRPYTGQCKVLTMPTHYHLLLLCRRLTGLSSSSRTQSSYPLVLGKLIAHVGTIRADRRSVRPVLRHKLDSVSTVSISRSSGEGDLNKLWIAYMLVGLLESRRQLTGQPRLSVSSNGSQQWLASWN